MRFEEVWESIRQHAGETFHQLGGKTFTYQADSDSLIPSTTEQPIPRHAFQRVYAWGEIPSQRKLRDMGIRDASFIFSILTDPRIVRL